jgi:uncharacterized protein (UPF0335 family)
VTSFAPLSSASSDWKKRKKTIAEDIKDVYGEAKAHGFDTTGAAQDCRACASRTRTERLEQEAILDTYHARAGHGSGRR